MADLDFLPQKTELQRKLLELHKADERGRLGGSPIEHAQNAIQQDNKAFTLAEINKDLKEHGRDSKFYAQFQTIVDNMRRERIRITNAELHKDWMGRGQRRPGE